MVTTFAVLPALHLQRYIKRYCLREIDTQGAELLKPLLASDESILALALTDTPASYHTNGNSSMIDLRDRHLFGLQTAFNGYQIFKGQYKLLCIEFNANGFFSLFNVPMTHIRNNLWSFDDIIGENLFYLNEQLYNTRHFSGIVMQLDRFFTCALQRRSGSGKYTEQISWAYHHLCRDYTAEVPQIAKVANMSLRNFEQKFTEQVGMTPILLKRIRRFQKAVALKAQQPGLSWTSIAYDCDYFDQMHLIKDFKAFSSLSPRSFFQQMPPPEEKIISMSSPTGTPVASNRLIHTNGIR